MIVIASQADFYVVDGEPLALAVRHALKERHTSASHKVGLSNVSWGLWAP